MASSWRSLGQGRHRSRRGSSTSTLFPLPCPPSAHSLPDPASPLSPSVLVREGTCRHARAGSAASGAWRGAAPGPRRASAGPGGTHRLSRPAPRRPRPQPTPSPPASPRPAPTARRPAPLDSPTAPRPRRNARRTRLQGPRLSLLLAPGGKWQPEPRPARTQAESGEPPKTRAAKLARALLMGRPAFCQEPAE